MNNQSQPTSSVPISTIIAELRANHLSVELAAKKLETVLAHQEGFKNDAIEADYQYRLKLANLGAAAEKHLGALLEAYELLKSEQGWVPVGEKLPETDKPVLVSVEFVYDNKIAKRVLRAFYVPPKTKVVDDDYEELEECDYDSEKDEYLWPTGWYEFNHCEETNWNLSDGTVTAWQELPSCYEVPSP